MQCFAQSLHSCLTLWPFGLYPTRLLCPWDSPGKNTGVPCPPPKDLPNLGIEPIPPVSPALQAGSLPTEPPGKPKGDEYPVIYHTGIDGGALVAKSCLTLCDFLDCSLPGSSAHRIFQVRLLEWVAISWSRESSLPRYGIQVSCTAGRIFAH